MSSVPDQRPKPAGPVGEPIAVVGVGCRLPGEVRDLAALSRVLVAGMPLLAPVPPDRWGEEFHDRDGRRQGTSNCHVGAFLSDIQRFDADFFGVSPREAREMDPQQRVLLEVAAETLESSGRSGEDWAGTRTGVFAGILASDYLVLHGRTRGLDTIDPFFATGKEFSFGAGRIAYTFDLRGPVMTVTTACSSSLLAVHLACQSLRAGECDTALAGGVNLLLAPDLTIFMSKVGALSASGRCTPFSAEADGVVRGEGCALVLLKRLADAQRDGDEVLAVLEGSAVNHDGRSAGLTVPSAPAQVQLLRQALRSAGVAAEQIGYVEAHATGTPLGDPIELAALSEVFKRAADNPGPGLVVGSHKAIFGHLDSAAGILGLLKAILVVREGVVPSQPALGELCTGFDWRSSDVRVARAETEVFCAPSVPRRAGVSAFGLSGTNVHVIVSQAPADVGAHTQAPDGRRAAVPVRIWGGNAHWLPGVRPGQQHAIAEAGPSPSTALESAAVVLSAASSWRPGPVAGSRPPGSPGPTAAAAAESVSVNPDQSDVSARVAGTVRTVLGLEPDAVLPSTRSLLEMGLNSVTAVELSTLLAAEFGRQPDATLAYLCPTVEELVDNFSQVRPSAVPQPAEPDHREQPAEVASQAPTPRQEGDHSRAGQAELAIVGMACQVPGAGSIDEFWNLVCAGEHQIRDLPARRLERDGWNDVDAEVPRRGGYLDRIEGFDALFFRISPLEAARMDPQQRLFLEVACDAVADAGIVVGTELARRTGVYTGMNTTDYQRLLTRDQADVDVYFGTGNSFSGTPGRLAYALDLGGPSISVDTACSSSLTAVHLAGQALRGGDCDAAVVGGVNVISGPTVSVSMARGGALAADGRSKTFAESADGYGRGEGAGVVVLKRLADAIEAGDRIYATILGSSINSDGASGGFTVPNAAAQTRAVCAALASAALEPADMGYVEAHGTGTPLGDPIELKALSQALRPGLPDRRQPVSVGSVKSLIGHLEAAAGVIGLIKAGLAIYHSRIPVHVTSGPLSTRVDWQELGLWPEDGNVGWPQGRSRVAGVSAFGFTGSNAHVILGQAPEFHDPTPSSPGSPVVLPISAASASALRASAGRLAAVLTADTSLSDVSFTLARRRSSHNFRAVVIADDVTVAVQALDALVSERAHPAVVFTGLPVNGADPVNVHFGSDDYLGMSWAQLPGQLLRRANDACAQIDALMPVPGQDISIAQRQRVASLRAQTGWTAIWRHLGVDLSSAHGEGVGAHTAAWLCGRLETAALVERSLNADGGPDELAAARAEPRPGPILEAVPPGMAAGAALAYVQAQAYVLGRPVNWDGVVPQRGRPAALPGYPWERRDYWFVPSGATAGSPGSAASAQVVADTTVHEIRADRQPAAAIGAGAGPPNDLLFVHEWSRCLPPATAAVSSQRGSWLIFAAPGSVLVDAVRRGLSRAGAEVRSVAIPTGPEGSWAAQLSAAGATSTPAGVVLIVGDESDAAALVMRYGQAVARFPGRLGRAHLITGGAHPEPAAAGQLAQPDPEQAAAWSVASVLATELSGRWGRTIDMSASVEADVVAGALLADEMDDQLRLSPGACYHRRIRRFHPVLEPGPSPIEENCVFAVCGTDASMVEPILSWLRGHGAEVPLVHLRAQSSSRPGAQQSEWLDHLTSLITDGRFGGVVYCCAQEDMQATVRDSGEADWAAAGAADELLAGVAERMQDSTGGLLLVVEDAAAEWGAVGAAVGGARRARALARLLRSSPSARHQIKVVSLLPRDQQSARREASSPLLEGSGIGRLSGEQVEGILEVVAAEPSMEALSAGTVDVPRYVSVCQRLAPRALLDDLATESAATELENPFLAEVRALGAARRAERLLELVLSSTAAVLDMQAREINPLTGFFDLGMDSITALALKTRLEAQTLTELPATLTFELPTPRQVADHLSELLASAFGSPASSHSASGVLDRGIDDPAPASAPITAEPSPDASALTDEELLRMLSAATSSARTLLKEGSSWS